MILATSVSSIMLCALLLVLWLVHHHLSSDIGLNLSIVSVLLIFEFSSFLSLFVFFLLFFLLSLTLFVFFVCLLLLQLFCLLLQRPLLIATVVTVMTIILVTIIEVSISCSCRCYHECYFYDQGCHCHGSYRYRCQLTAVRYSCQIVPSLQSIP